MWAPRVAAMGCEFTVPLPERQCEQKGRVVVSVVSRGRERERVGVTGVRALAWEVGGWGGCLRNGRLD